MELNDDYSTIIEQIDGNISIGSSDNSSDTIYDTDEEAFADVIPANLAPVADQILVPGRPIKWDDNPANNQSPDVPLCLLFNARSVFNKADHLMEMLHQLGPDICLVSETFERERKKLSTQG